MPAPDFPYSYKVLNLDLTNGLNELCLPVHTEAIYYHQGTSTLEIKLNSTSKDTLKFRPKNKIEAPVSVLYISAAPRNETIELFLAKPKEITLGGGEVRVLTDAGFFNSIAAKAFTAGLYRAANAANYGFVCLCNPSGSGIKAIITDIQIRTSGDSVFIHVQNAACESTVIRFHNKYIHLGTNSLCYIYSGLDAAHVGIYVTRYATQVNVPLTINPVDYFIIPEGWIFYCYTDAINQDIRATFNFREEEFIPE